MKYFCPKCGKPTAEHNPLSRTLWCMRGECNYIAAVDEAVLARLQRVPTAGGE